MAALRHSQILRPFLVGGNRVFPRPHSSTFVKLETEPGCPEAETGGLETGLSIHDTSYTGNRITEDAPQPDGTSQGGASGFPKNKFLSQDVPTRFFLLSIFSNNN